jgi:hypothetical protein
MPVFQVLLLQTTPALLNNCRPCCYKDKKGTPFMLNTAFTLMLLTALFFIFGMIKPKWMLFWMKSPDRAWILAITALLIMGSFTLFGEANKRLREEQQAAAKKAAPAPPTASQTSAPPPPPSPVPESAPETAPNPPAE